MQTKIYLGIALALFAGCSTDDTSIDDEDAASMQGFTGNEYDVAHLPAVLATGDLVRNGHAAALVPAPGESVTAETLRADGTGDEVAIEVDDDGTVKVNTGDPSTTASEALQLDAATPGACHDRRFHLDDKSWHETLEYRFQASSTRLAWHMPVAFAEDAIRKAGEHIVNAHNNCGRADHVNATIRYLGRTTRGVNITRGDICAKRDGHSVVAFGNFDDQSILAATCTWAVKHWDPRAQATLHFSVESDIRISGDSLWWLPGDDCTVGGWPEGYDLESVLTHERGHSFGLQHVSNSYLTMAPSISLCDRSARTLGLGDMLGLEVMY